MILFYAKQSFQEVVQIVISTFKQKLSYMIHNMLQDKLKIIPTTIDNLQMSYSINNDILPNNIRTLLNNYIKIHTSEVEDIILKSIQNTLHHVLTLLPQWIIVDPGIIAILEDLLNHIVNIMVDDYVAKWIMNTILNILYEEYDKQISRSYNVIKSKLPINSSCELTFKNMIKNIDYQYIYEHINGIFHQYHELIPIISTPFTLSQLTDFHAQRYAHISNWFSANYTQAYNNYNIIDNFQTLLNSYMNIYYINHCRDFYKTQFTNHTNNKLLSIIKKVQLDLKEKYIQE